MVTCVTHGKRVFLNIMNSFQNLKRGFIDFQFISNIIQRNDTGTNTHTLYQRYKKKQIENKEKLYRFS